MKIEKQLSPIKTPLIYQREGKDCYFDPYRKKLIEITPEETVRQKVAALFEQTYDVPREMISLEVHMAHFVEGAKGRADIIISAFDKEQQGFYPLAIIECKNCDVFLTDKVVDQAIRYTDLIGAQYFIITNGIEIFMASYQEETDSYLWLDDILTYNQMLKKEYTLPATLEQAENRFTLEELKNQELISEYNNDGTWVFGEGTTSTLRTFAINLYQCFLDTEHLLPPVKRKTFELVEDIGRKFMDYSNAGGGHYNGIYRAFLVKDRHNETQVVSLSLFGTDASFRGENRSSYTSLVVAIDHFKTSHNSLQYNIDRYSKLKPNGVIEFFHNGQIGGFKSESVLSKVNQFGGGLTLMPNSIYLGKVKLEKMFYLDDIEIAEFVYNLIEYALLREEVRKEK